MKTYQVESVLRPAIELWSAATAYLAAALLIIAPGAILMTPDVAYSGSLLLVLFGLFRTKDGIWIIRYRRGLLRMPRYVIKASKVPVSDSWLYLGRGFEWDRLHTQRLRDARKESRTYLRHGAVWRWARRIEKTWENRTGLLRGFAFVAFLVSRDSFWNPLRPAPPIGGKPELHGVGLLDEAETYTAQSERVGHTLVMGTTRVGKSQLAKLFVTQDIRRGDSAVITMDPKGDADLMLTTISEGLRTGRPVYLFHLGFPKMSCRYNSVGHFQRITEVSTRLTDALPSQGSAAAFKEFGWRFINIIAQAEVALSRRPHFQNFRRYISNIEPLFLEYARFYLEQSGLDGWQASVETIKRNLNPKTIPRSLQGREADTIAILKYIQERDIYEPVLDGLITAVRYERSYFDKIVASVGPLLEKLTTGRIAELISPDYDDIDDDRPIIDWMSVIRQKAIVYIGLDALSDSMISGAVGAAMFADITSTLGDIYKHGLQEGMPTIRYKNEFGQMNSTDLDNTKVNLHADEFNELVGDQFIPMMNKGGGAGLQVTAYTQTGADVEAGIGDAAKAEQIKGNFNTLIMMRVKTIDTAEILTSMVPPVQVDLLTSRTGANDNSDPESDVDFTSSTMGQVSSQDVPAIEPADLTQLPKGQAFALLDGGRLFKLRFPLVKTPSDVPRSVVEMAQIMRKKYDTGEKWFKDEFAESAPWRDDA